jgi:hypothetical protein
MFILITIPVTSLFGEKEISQLIELTGVRIRKTRGVLRTWEELIKMIVDEGSTRIFVTAAGRLIEVV